MSQKIKDLIRDEPYLVSKIKTISKQKPPHAVILRGAPDDRGVFNVGGRVGASLAPTKIRTILKNFFVGAESNFNRSNFLWGNDIYCEESIEVNHRAIVDAIIGDWHKGHLSIIMGGGHDYGYCQAAAAAQLFGPKNYALINIDAHLDVREVKHGVITSGSPFFLAIENGHLLPKNFIEYGIQNHCNSTERLRYLRDKKAKIYNLEKIKHSSQKLFASILKKIPKQKKIIVSIDLDAFQEAVAPGVSAPQSDGFTSSDFFSFLDLAATHKNIAGLGFFEANPILDSNDRTSRLVATGIHQFATKFLKNKQ